MKINRDQILKIIYVFVAILIIYFGIKWWNRDVITIKTAEIINGKIESVVSASGIVDAPVYELGSKFGGKIATLKVKEGDNVRKGQLLAEFDSYEQARNDYGRTKDLFDDGAASEQAFDAAKTAFESSRIVAPNNGIVGKINFLEGETVVPGSPAIVVVNYDKSWVEAQIDEIDIGNVKMGDTVKITTDVYPDKVFDGEIYWIAPLAELRKVGGRIKMDEESYVFPCKIKFLGEHLDLKVNMSVNVEVVTKTSEEAMLVPREALVSRDDSTYVFITQGNRVFESKIGVGIRSFGSIEAISGVTVGDKVAITNVLKLKNKGRVKIEH